MKMKPCGGGHEYTILFGILSFTWIITNGEGVRNSSITKKYFLSGETFTLTCVFKSSEEFSLNWTYPSATRINRVQNKTQIRKNESLESNITIVNATFEDSGMYNCTSNNLNDAFEKTWRVIILDEPLLELTIPINQKKIKERRESGATVEVDENPYGTTLSIAITAYPTPTYWFQRDGQNISTSSSKYDVIPRGAVRVTLQINNLTVTDTAKYTLVATNNVGNKIATKKFIYDLRVIAPPVLKFNSTSPIRKSINESVTLVCDITGYPRPKITWEFVAEDNSSVKIAAKTVPVSLYEQQSSIELLIQKSGIISCAVENETKITREIYAYDIKNGFGIKDGVRWYPVHDTLTLECLASKHDYSSVTWENESEHVQNFTKGFSRVALLKINDIQKNKSGEYEYKCVAIALQGENSTKSVLIHVEANRGPAITKPIQETVEASKSQPVELTCVVDAVPPPSITWYKDGVQIENSTNEEIKERLDNHTVLTSTIVIYAMKEDDQGKYECFAENLTNYTKANATKVINLMLPVKKSIAVYIAIFCVVFLTLMAIVIFLMWKVKKEKQFRKELAAAGLLYFKEGALTSINPELNVDQQAELLPYDDRFEFPVENLNLGKQLGAGAFGVVYKAEARGILNAEETTIVAVKTVNKNADNMYIKALASELKIMVHMGKHVNIVNLLGACTQKIQKRELMVIVEYCRFGNIHDYLMKHREVFINQLTADSNEEKFGNENRAYSCSNDSGMRSDYGGLNLSHSTQQSFLTTANSGQSTRKASNGYVRRPEWCTNYESDYQTVAPRPLFSQDLLAWAFQIARGMEYLASRKILHGDLAARNVVLADDNVVKICDFGLARSIYKNDEYRKKGDGLLPLKWLAVECITDGVFSTQSDVWSFGILLWEIFSLAKTPYPSHYDTHDLLKFLSAGNRLEKPKYAHDKLYFVMRRCWEIKPTQRPSFTQLQEVLGSFLDEAVRKRYTDLNSSYMDQNAQNADREDYLAMMNSPDYNNLVTPSPFGYGNSPNNLNQTFFPPTPKEDDSGYLQSTKTDRCLTPMTPTSKFTFDSQQLNKAPSKLSNHASELTPMLNLDNLLESGSQSDQEGHSSYPNCPRIEEELDEVFDINEEKKDSDHTSAVANPSYITMADIATSSGKSQNGYVNSIPKILKK